MAPPLARRWHAVFGVDDDQTLVTVAIGGILLAAIIALAGALDWLEFWSRFLITLLFVQWIVLISVLLLRLIRPRLERLSMIGVTMVIYLVVMAVTLCFSWLGIVLWGYLDQPIDGTVQWRIITINSAISTLVLLIVLRYLYLHQVWRRAIEAEAELRLLALQARIRPHFLFNTLNTIAYLVPHQPERAEEAVLDLADLFRLTLKGDSRVTLAEELEITRRYLELEAFRLGERLQVQWRLEEGLPMAHTIPALLVQPLVENAVHHGIQQLPHGGEVVIAVERTEAALTIAIENPRPDPIPPAATQRGSGLHIAQSNIRQRLRLTYGTKARMLIQASPGRYSVTLQLPLEEAAG